MTEPTRDQLLGALRKADAAGDTEAARAIARRIADIDRASGEGMDIPQEYNLAEAAADVGRVTATSAAKAVASPIDLAMDVGGTVQQGITSVLTPAIAGGLELFGFDNAADAVREGGQARQADIAQQTQQLQFRNALEQVAPTPKGFENSALGAEIVAGLAIPFKTARGPIKAPTPQPASEAQQVIAEGARRNVPVMTTDVLPPRSGAGRAARAMGENIPIAGTSGPRATQQAARQDAVRQVVEEFGGDTGRALFDDSETLSQQVSAALTKSRSEKLSRLTTAKDSVIDGIEAPFNGAPNTLRAIGEEVRRLRGIDAEEFAPVIDRLQRFAERLQSGNMTLRQVEENRRLLGELFADNNLANIKGAGQKSINRIYEPLRRDMGEFIEATAGNAARAKWQRANDELAGMAGDLKSSAFRGVLRDADTTPEKVSRILFSGSADPADIKRLVDGLDEAGKRKVQGALMTRAWERAGGADGVSVERFLNNLKSLSNQIGVAFQGADRESLEGVRRLLEATRRASGAAVKDIPTGVQNAPTIMGFGAASLAGPVGGAATLGVGGLVARLYESAGMRNLLVGLAKSKAGSAGEKAALSRIMKSAAPIINNWQDDMARVANDNVGVAAVAEEDSSQ